MNPVRDLLICGGGPAGLVTALHARRAGLEVTVVEPRQAPIDKACGEGLMPPAVQELGELGVTPGGRSIRGICYRQGRRRAVADFRDGTGLGVRRTALHAALYERAVAAGVEMITGRVREVEQDGTTVSAAGLSARYLVAADGLHSPVRHAVGLDRPARALRWGVRAHFGCAPWTDLVEVHWSPAAEAYVTPVAQDCVGVALLGADRRPFYERLRDFPELLERLPAQPVAHPRGAGPLRQRAAARVCGRVLLVGDAAGYLDALTGEGLAISFRCARALVARLRADDPVGYEADYRRITRRYRLITAAVLAAAGRPGLRRRIVPAAQRMPRLFTAAVGQLAR
jgi:flavin-dependent dehydrogenase